MSRSDLVTKDEEQVVLSYELLQLMEWLLRYETDSLKKIVSRALKNGLLKSLKKSAQVSNSSDMSNMSNTIASFINLLELLLLESTNEHDTSNIINKNLLPELSHIDTTNCNPSIIQSSAAIVSSKKEKNPRENAQELLFKEILKRWKPKKKQSEN